MGSPLNYWYCHSSIKLAHTTWMIIQRNQYSMRFSSIKGGLTVLFYCCLSSCHCFIYNIVTVFTVLKRILYKSSLIANEVNTNMCLISLKNPLLFHFVPLFTPNEYNNNYNNNCLFDTTVRYFAYNLFVSANLYSLDFHSRILLMLLVVCL